MKKLLSIICLSAFTFGALNVQAAVSNTTSISIDKDKDKDKDKEKDKDKDKKNKEAKKGCCSSTAAKSCSGEAAKPACGSQEQGKASHESGNAGAATAPKSCCNKGAATKSCSGGEKK